MAATRALEPRWRVLEGEDGLNPRNGHRRRAIDRANARMGMGRAKELQMQQAIDGDVERVARGARDHGGSGRCWQASAASLAGRIVLHVIHAADRILDGAIAGTAADIPLERASEILPLRLVQR